MSKCENVLAIGDKMFTATPKESIPEAKYEFDNWSAETKDLPDVITGTVTIYANFSTTTIPTVTVSSGSNGTVAGADTKTVDYGAEITVDGVNLTIGKWKCTAIPDKETSTTVFAF